MKTVLRLHSYRLFVVKTFESKRLSVIKR
jgi:hypothetical protein